MMLWPASSTVTRCSSPRGCTRRFQTRCVRRLSRDCRSGSRPACVRAGKRPPACHLLLARQAAAARVRSVERRGLRRERPRVALTSLPQVCTRLRAATCWQSRASSWRCCPRRSRRSQPDLKTRCARAAALARGCASPRRAGARRLRGRVLAGRRVPQVQPKRARRVALPQGACGGPVLLERVRGAVRAGRRERSCRAAEQREVRRTPPHQLLGLLFY